MKIPEVLPDNLPVPIDDGKAKHLEGSELPSLCLDSTSGKVYDVSLLGNCVLFVFPMAGSPVEGEFDFKSWEAVPGARGCTPQSCSYRDLKAEFDQLGIQVVGLSVQGVEALQEVRDRLHIPFDLLSDKDMKLAKELRLPTFEFQSRVFIKRITLVIRQAIIEKVFYPVFPPDKDADTVLKYLRT